MKREKAIKELKVERPRRVVGSEKDALKRMKNSRNGRSNSLATANNRLARESAKLDKAQEQELADQGLASEAAEWREY